MKYREASLAEVLCIAEIHTASWRDTYQSVLTKEYLANKVPRERIDVWKDRLENSKPNQYVLVAEYSGDIVGFSCFYAGENSDYRSYLDNLHVRKSYQSKGVGKALLIEGARWCSYREPAKGLCLLVNQDNNKAQNFYRSLGAYNAKSSVWNAPDDSIVRTYWFVWKDFAGLLDS
jgi:ribosomal protein S18 acetylase RimI-like enzyme